MFRWKSFAVANQSVKTAKVFHLERIALYGIMRAYCCSISTTTKFHCYTCAVSKFQRKNFHELGSICKICEKFSPRKNLLYGKYFTSSYPEISALYLLMNVHTTALLFSLTASCSGVSPYYNR